MDRQTGQIVKAQNVVFEEGQGNWTIFEQSQLKDKPIFEEEVKGLEGVERMGREVGTSNEAQVP